MTAAMLPYLLIALSFLTGTVGLIKDLSKDSLTTFERRADYVLLLILCATLIGSIYVSFLTSKGSAEDRDRALALQASLDSANESLSTTKETLGEYQTELKGLRSQNASLIDQQTALLSKAGLIDKNTGELKKATSGISASTSKLNMQTNQLQRAQSTAELARKTETRPLTILGLQLGVGVDLTPNPTFTFVTVAFELDIADGLFPEPGEELSIEYEGRSVGKLENANKVDWVREQGLRRSKRKELQCYRVVLNDTDEDSAPPIPRSALALQYLMNRTFYAHVWNYSWPDREYKDPTERKDSRDYSYTRVKLRCTSATLTRDELGRVSLSFLLEPPADYPGIELIGDKSNRQLILEDWNDTAVTYEIAEIGHSYVEAADGLAADETVVRETMLALLAEEEGNTMAALQIKSGNQKYRLQFEEHPSDERIAFVDETSLRIHEWVYSQP